MKTVQLVYPRNSNISLRNVIYCQIGIEHPHSIPISEIFNDNFQAILRIGESANNSKIYTITDKEILEFGNIYFNSLYINILDISNPYLIIDIAYKEAG